MSKYDELIRENKESALKEEKLFSRTLEGANEILEDKKRVISLYQNADKELIEIDKQFALKTGLDKVDISFLMLATALQICRWIAISLINKEYRNVVNVQRVPHDDINIKKMEESRRNEYKKNYIEKHGDTHKDRKSKHRDWANIVFDSVPYDITEGSRAFGVNMEGGYHRIHTLGHDPVLGWVFGVMNILSDTITLDKTYGFMTYDVEMMKKPKRWIKKSSIFASFYDAFSSIKEDKTRLPAAVFAQGLHLDSDVYTKLGLPIPVLEAFNPDLASKLYKEEYDSLKLAEDIRPYAINGLQMAFSILINMLISVVHGLFYNSDLHGSKDMYEIKTRKILTISNTIATSSNLIWVGGSVASGNETAIEDLDIGGLLVTIYRLISDTRFIYKVKKEYLEKEWTSRVLGEEYNFMKEEN